MAGNSFGTNPVDARPPERAYHNQLRTWTQNLLESTLKGGQDTQFAGRGQWKSYDWPVPLGSKRPYPNDLRSFIEPANVQLIGQDTQFADRGQFKTYDYPNPSGANKPYPNDLRSFIEPANVQLIGQDKQFGAAGQFKVYDYPNPLGSARPYPNDLRTWIQYGPPLTAYTAQPLPFDWQPSSGAQYPPSLRTGAVNLLQSTLASGALPPGVAYYDRCLSDPPCLDWTWNGTLRLNSVYTFQPTSFDWGTPRAPYRPQYGLTTSFIPPAEVVQRAPLRSLPAQRIPQPPTWTQNLAIILTAPTTLQPLPFDWGLAPTGPLLPQRGLTFSMRPDLIPAQPKPYNQYDWPLPQPPHLPPALTWTQDLVRTTLAPSAYTFQPLPFDWGLPDQLPRPALSFAYSAFPANISPTPSPPPPAPSADLRGGGLPLPHYGWIRKHRRKFEDAQKAAREAELRACAAQQAEVAIAAQKAQQVIADQAEQAQAADLRQIDRITRALKAAHGASLLSDGLKHADAISQYNRAIVAHMREAEDEEDAITLLMS